MTAHRFWRFSVQSNNGASTTAFADFAISVAPHAANLSSIATTTESATQKTFEFPEAQQVGAYSFSANGFTAPKSWLFEYSDNGAIFHVAHIEHAQQNWQNETRFFSAELFELSLAVNGSNAAAQLNAFIHDMDGNLILKSTALNGTNSILMPNSNPVSVTVMQEIGKMWQAGIFCRAGELVFSTNPTTTPYYYRNRNAGVTGLHEPEWSTNPEVLTHDNNCIFELIERFNQPITQSPLIPTRKTV